MVSSTHSVQLKSGNLFWVLGLLLLTWGLLSASPVRAGGPCNSGSPDTIACTTDQDCANQECPSCVVCNTTTGFCEADDSICEGLADNDCVSAECSQFFSISLNPTGCDYNVAVFSNPSQQLEEICYYCDPARITSISTCGNGVCNTEFEDCQTCPDDCLVPGFDDACPASQETLDLACTVFTITFPGPPFNEFSSFSCEDGDVCTNNVCDTGLQQCTVTPKTCSQDSSDLCCPAGCQGPPTGISSCEEAAEQGLVPFEECDVDCWPTQSCGDTLVESPETCDDTVPGPNAGINVTDEQCRDAGSVAECTYCGDGFIQAEAGEECDGTNDSACGGEGCNTNCTCNLPVDICVTGSGNPINTIRAGCGNCSLQKGTVSNGWQSYAGWLSLLFLIPASWVLRRRLKSEL